MYKNNFWQKLKKPIIGLAPMDGVTDAAFRYMVCKHSKPSVVYTEFTNVEGLARGATKMIHAFLYNEIERPIVAQIFGKEVDSFYKVTIMLAYLGFDGVDINMGCPVKKVAKKGSGAALIKNPKLAQEIIKSCKKAAKDWNEGITLKQANVHVDIIKAIKGIRPNEGKTRKLLPISVKTRIGYDKIITEEWMKCLLEEKPAAICLHGRTLNQLYFGEANWEEIAKASEIVRKENIVFLGNGDVESMKDAKEKIEKYKVDGVLVGRASFGNPCFFSDKIPTIKEKLNMTIEHAEYMENHLPLLPFIGIRKHLGWYCKGFEGAKELRQKLMKVNNLQEIKQIIRSST